jgi:hypothetical protein
LKEWIIKYRNHILIVTTIIISCIIYWNYLIGHFANETYGVALNYQNYAIKAYLVDGRFFSFLFLILADKLHIPILMLMSISLFIAIVVATIAVLQLKNEISKLTELTQVQEFAVWLIAYCTIFNFMMVEIMYFPETCIMVSSILCYIIAARFFTHRKYIKSLVILVIGVFCYQGTIGFFAVCCFLFSLIKNKKIGKEVILDVCKIALMGIIASGLNLLFIKSISVALNLTQHKVFSFSINKIKQNIIYMLTSIYPILQNNCGLFPKNLLLICIEIILLFTLIISYNEKKDRVVNLIALTLVTIMSSFIMFVVQSGSMYTGRVHFCIGSLIGIMFLYLYSMTNIKNKHILKYIFLAMVIMYCVANCVNASYLVREHQKVNTLEKEECNRIGNLIEQYENENNIQIKKIAPILILNQTEKGFFKETTRRTIITYNNVRHYYGYSSILEYYLRKGLQDIGLNVESQNKYMQYIIENGLEYGDIVCIEDTLYCPQYIT